MDMSPVVAGSRLGASGATLAYADRTIVESIDVQVPDGKITVIVGPNGCGKSTLLRALARLMTPRSGSVLLDGRDIHSLPTREVAKRLGLLPQAPISPEGILVADLVARGRTMWASLPVLDMVLRREVLFSAGLEQHADVVGDYEVWPGRRLVDTTAEERLLTAATWSMEMQESRLAHMGLA